MTEHGEFRTREDGTIDYAHYMARGRALRSAAFLSALGKLRPSFGGGGRLRALGRVARRRASIEPVRRGATLQPGE